MEPPFLFIFTGQGHREAIHRQVAQQQGRQSDEEAHLRPLRPPRLVPRPIGILSSFVRSFTPFFSALRFTTFGAHQMADLVPGPAQALQHSDEHISGQCNGLALDTRRLGLRHLERREAIKKTKTVDRTADPSASNTRRVRITTDSSNATWKSRLCARP